MIRMFRLRKDAKGAAAIEMALAIPILLELFWLIFQAGLVFRAMSGIQHGLGEGARYATLYPQPVNSQIKTKISDTVYGIGPGNFTIATPSPGTADGANYLDLTVSYTQDTDLIFIPGPTITVSRSKRVWVSS
ncbi:MAG: TadE family protein [Sphingomicrobium sp.]